MIVEGSATPKFLTTEPTERSVAGMASYSEGCVYNIPGGQDELEESRTGHATTDMAHGKYLYDIPYGVTREIVMSMDADKSWESLAGEIGYSFDKIKHFELEYQKYCGSPTKALLWDWGSRNATVKDLYTKLKVLSRVREMKILENYVANAKESNHICPDKLLNSHKEDSSQSLPCISTINIDDLPRPPPPRRQPSEVESDSNEINFNQPKCNVTKSKVSSKILPDSSVKDKQYDDKKIPGTNLNSKMSENLSHPHHSSRVPQESVSTATTEPTKASESTDSSSFDFSSFEKSDPMKGFETLKSYMKSDNITLDDAVALMGTPFFEYKELFEATDGFSTSHKLGTGAFGTVFQGTLRCSKCAIKRLDGENKDLKNINSSQLRSEITALLRYRHENIVNLYGYAFDGPSLCLVYQYMTNGSLEDRLQCKDNTAALSWDRRIIIASGAARGLHFLHHFGSKPLIHGDIKSANILLDKHFEAKIGDLGQAQHANSGALTGKFTHITQKDASSKIYGTKAYLAPETLRSGGNMSVKSDVFAFGVVLLEICSGEKPLDDKREGNKFLTNYFKELQDETKEDEHKLCQLFRDKRAGDCPESFVISLISTAANCLKDKKKDRIEMEKLLHHLEDIEERWKDTHMSSSDISSFSSSVQSNHLSHESGPDFSAPNLAQNPEKSSHFSGQPVSVMSGKQPPSFHPKSDVQQEPLSPVEIFRGKEFSTLPEALQLQLMADAKKEGNFDQIALYKAMNKQRDGEDSMEGLKSDPRKMHEINKCNAEFDRKNNPLATQDVSSSVVMKSDPRKLEALKQFDKDKPMVREPDESSESESQEQTGNYIGDPEKIKKIEEFDRQNLSVSMHSQVSPSIAVHQQALQGGCPQVTPGLQLVYSQRQVPSVLTQDKRQVNVTPHNPRLMFSSNTAIGHHGYQHLSGSGHMYVGDMSQMRHQLGENILSQSPTSNVGSSPNISGNFSGSGSYFSSESQPTIVRADLPASPGGKHLTPDLPSSKYVSPVNPGVSVMPVIEVCEDSTPMAKNNVRYGQLTSHSVPRQMTYTNTSQNITYSSAQQKSHSFPEQTSSAGQVQTFNVTDVHPATSCDDRSVQYRPHIGSTKQPSEYRQSEGFPYTGLTFVDQGEDHDNVDDELLHGDGQREVSSPDQTQSFADEGRRGESSVDPAVFHSDNPDKKMKNFFDSYFQAVANECEGDDGEEEEEEDNSVTDINV